MKILAKDRIGWRLDGIRAGLLAGLGGATLVGYACAEQLVWYPK